MANRKVLIESILGLAQKLGANPNKFMGTKSNINFLGTGDKGMKGTTFSGQLNDDFLNLGFGKDDMIKIIEQDAGYVSAGKLNDMQLNTMFNNLKMIDETFSPPALPPGPMNVIDLETGTRNINKEGLESLRETDQIKRFTKGLGTSKTAMTNKIKEGIESLKTKLTGGGDDIATKAQAEADFNRMGAADFGDSIAAEGARRAVVRQVMTREPDLFQLPPEMAESIAKSKDLGKGGSNFPDPLIVFANKGNFTRKELELIDEFIQQSPFSRSEEIAESLLLIIKQLRPDGFKFNYAEGGRIGFKSGKSVKEGIAALLKLGNKKFGKDKIKVADDIEPSEFSKFNERNRQMTNDEIRDFADEFGIDPTEDYYNFDGTLASAQKIVKDQKAYEAGMFTEYKAGRLDPKPGESGRKKFLEKKAEDAEMSGDSRLFTPDEADELASMQNYGGIENAEVPVEMMTEDLLLIKYPGISERLARLIGNDTNLQRKAEAIAAIEQGLALQGAGKSVDETIEILKREPKTKMKSGGLAQILEM